MFNRLRHWLNKSFTRFHCVDCEILVRDQQELNLVEAIRHRIDGHYVIRAWKEDYLGWKEVQVDFPTIVLETDIDFDKVIHSIEEHQKKMLADKGD